MPVQNMETVTPPTEITDVSSALLFMNDQVFNNSSIGGFYSDMFDRVAQGNTVGLINRVEFGGGKVLLGYKSLAPEGKSISTFFVEDKANFDDGSTGLYIEEDKGEVTKLFEAKKSTGFINPDVKVYVLEDMPGDDRLVQLAKGLKSALDKNKPKHYGASYMYEDEQPLEFRFGYTEHELKALTIGKLMSGKGMPKSVS